MTSVLIIDDSKTARMMMKHWVLATKPDTQVHEADSGEDGLRLIQDPEINIDCAIVDYNMSGMSGLDFVQQAVPGLPAKRIALCTANIQDIIRERATSLGIFYMAKPITPIKIKQIMQELEI